MAASCVPYASVIVVGYNSRHFLDGCLEALLQQSYPGEFEILFVDNASTDGGADYVRTHFPLVRVIDSGRNLGYAGGNNLGANLARGAVLAFVNPDTRAEPGWLRELVRPLMADPTIGITTSKIVLMDRPDVINTCGNDLSLSGITTCRRAGEPVASVRRDEDVAAVSGAACAIRADLFRLLGGFDQRFWMYLEDTDLSWRARLAGYRCQVAIHSVISHDYVFTLSPAKLRRIERNRYLMLSKNLSGRTLLAFLPYLMFSELMTWCWAASQGPNHLRAKLCAAVSTLESLGELQRSRRSVQVLRRVSDGSLLRQHRRMPTARGMSVGLITRVAWFVALPIATFTASVSLALIDDRR
jgi:GT2 family glycosyltransferase